MGSEEFQFLEHPADLKFLARGETLEKCFQASAKAIFSGMVDLNFVSEKIEKKIEIKSNNLENLLHDFLSEFLFLFATSGLLFSKFKVKIKKENYRLTAIAYGEKFNPEKHQVHTEIKAVTYHDLFIGKDKEGGWKAIVLCDI